MDKNGVKKPKMDKNEFLWFDENNTNNRNSRISKDHYNTTYKNLNTINNKKNDKKNDKNRLANKQVQKRIKQAQLRKEIFGYNPTKDKHII